MSRPIWLASGWPLTTIACGASVTIALPLNFQARAIPEAGSGAPVPRPAQPSARTSARVSGSGRRRRKGTSWELPDVFDAV